MKRLNVRVRRAAAVLGIAAAVGGCQADAPEEGAGTGAPEAGAPPAAGQAAEAGAAPVALPAASRVDTTVLGSMRVVVADTLLTLSDGKARTTASLQEYINSSGQYAHRLLDARRSGDGAAYLLLRTVGLSRPQDPNGHCGAGDETNVTWLRVDSALRVAKGQTVLVASCMRNREPVGGSDELRGEPWSVAFYIPGDSITTMAYDRRFPERGIRVTTAPDTTAR